MTALEFIEEVVRNEGVCPYKGKEVIDLIEGVCDDCDSDVNFHIGDGYFEMSNCRYYGNYYAGSGKCSLDWCHMLRELRGNDGSSRN